MSKITATFDGLKITIKGAESATAHQLYIVSLELERLAAFLVVDAGAKKATATVELFEGFDPIVDANNLSRGQHLALAAEFALAAQHIFSLPRLSTVVQKTFQAIAEQAQAQQIMAGVKRSPGGVLTPH